MDRAGTSFGPHVRGQQREMEDTATRPLAVVTGASSGIDSVKARLHRRLAEPGSARK
jgi:hypothetical protein